MSVVDEFKQIKETNAFESFSFKLNNDDSYSVFAKTKLNSFAFIGTFTAEEIYLLSKEKFFDNGQEIVSETKDNLKLEED